MSAVNWVEGFGGQPEFPTDAYAVSQYYQQFSAREDALPDV